MPCQRDNYCSMCSIPSLRRLITLSEACTKEQTEWQYAAINSYEPATGVPMMSSHKVFSSTPRRHISCVSYLSSLSTLLSVSHSLSYVPDVIHFGKPDAVTYSDLMKSTDSVRRLPDAHTMAIEFKDAKPHRLHLSGGDVVLNFNESIASKISSLLKESEVLCWHWTNDSAWAANIFQSSKQSLWMCHNACNTTRRLRLSSESHTVAGIPLHSDPASGDTVTFNIGAPSLDTRSSVSGPYAESVKSVATEFLECVMKDGKCYSCSRVCKIHNDICGRTRQNLAREQRVSLSQQFIECLILQ
jgi:hypothetical protein